MRRVVVILSLLIAGLTACTSTPAGHDEHLTIGDGVVSVHVPASHAGVGVIVLHSYGHDAKEPVAQGWSTAADRHGFVAIYPDRGSSWDAGLCCGAAASSQRDDVTWLSSVVAAVRLKYGLTTIYLTGNSNGGMMVERLLAERPEASNAFAVWGSAPEMPAAGPWTGRGHLYDGIGDMTVPWKGGSVQIAGTPTLIRPTQTTNHWLVGAHLSGHEVPGYGHAPEPGWPETAWRALTS
jgi:poly(3-hydroxybutyrate) depolymerase